MKKQLILVGIMLLFLIVGLSGCNDNKNGSSKINDEKILGLWTETIPGTPLIITMNFITNISYYESINETRIWGTYTMTDETITLQSGGATHTFQYSFSNNENTLTLVQTDNGEVYLVLTRQ
jgi:hypothetical protein